ncbi:hypothetical protein DFP72DRAFT_1041933 [Ephemerocybe angulata]|uniref:Uncharacterized protein n=1 Tax=Ephemerocybe angulata TaxID=980116 RepID=A0A8H6MB19_9AGAR|nr:hypothetical protein DFP72DRAFT_1041933 [Tulosesus angulatus]
MAGHLQVAHSKITIPDHRSPITQGEHIEVQKQHASKVEVLSTKAPPTYGINVLALVFEEGCEMRKPETTGIFLSVNLNYMLDSELWDGGATRRRRGSRGAAPASWSKERSRLAGEACKASRSDEAREDIPNLALDQPFRVLHATPPIWSAVDRRSSFDVTAASSALSPNAPEDAPWPNALLITIRPTYIRWRGLSTRNTKRNERVMGTRNARQPAQSRSPLAGARSTQLLPPPSPPRTPEHRAQNFARALATFLAGIIGWVGLSTDGPHEEKPGSCRSFVSLPPPCSSPYSRTPLFVPRH